MLARVRSGGRLAPSTLTSPLDGDRKAAHDVEQRRLAPAPRRAQETNELSIVDIEADVLKDLRGLAVAREHHVHMLGL